MVVEGLGVEREGEQEGGRGLRIHVAAAAPLHLVAGRRRRRSPFAGALVEAVLGAGGIGAGGAGADGGELAFEARQPLVAVEAAEFPVADRLGVLDEALAQ